MDIVHVDASLSLALFGAILLAREAGRAIGRRRHLESSSQEDGTGALEAAVYALYGLLVAFTFGSAMSRFDERQSLIVEEANVIDSAWSAIDLLPPDVQPALRDAMRRYADARIEAHRRIPDWAATRKALAEADALGEGMWKDVTGSLRAAGYPGSTTAVAQAFGALSDSRTKRRAAMSRQQLPVVFALLVVFALGSALASGFAGSLRPRRAWFHAILFASMSAIALFVILDLEHPRQGLIRLDHADQVLIDLRAAMGPVTR